MENLSIDEQAKSSYWWHVKDSLDSIVHPCFDWDEIRRFFFFFACWLGLPVLIWIAAYLRRNDAIEAVRQHQLFNEDIEKE